MDIPTFQPTHKPTPFYIRLGTVVLGSLIALAIAIGIFVLIPEESAEGDSEGLGSSSYDFTSCNVVGIEVRDCLVAYYPETETTITEGCDTLTSSEEIMTILEDAKKDSSIKAVLLQTDSTGGYPITGEEIADAIKDAGKPSVAWVRSAALSAAYWAISPADLIIASANSDIGSIGVTQSYVDYSVQNEDSGLTYNSLSTGKFKDTGDPEKALTEEERALLERDLYIMRDNFVSAVAENRGLPREKVLALADGSLVLGAAAKETGLIDQIGGKREVWAELERLVGEEPSICWPQYEGYSD